MQSRERAEARRRDILLAAAHVFARQGYHDATVDDIALKLGVTKAVVYYHFRSKEEILAEISATTIRDATERLEAIIAGDERPDGKLRAAITDLVTHVFDELDHFAIILQPLRELSPGTRAEVRALGRRYEGLIRSIVETCMREGLVIDGDAAIMTMTMIRACLAISEWFRPDGPLPLETVKQQVIRQVLAGVLR